MKPWVGGHWKQREGVVAADYMFLEKWIDNHFKTWDDRRLKNINIYLYGKSHKRENICRLD